MATLNFLYRSEYPITDDIKVIIPKVKKVLEDEDSYYSMVHALTAMPIDMMVQLDDMGVDFTKISSYELFVLIFQTLKKENMDTSLVFGDLDVDGFDFITDKETGKISLYNKRRDILIDRRVQSQIASALRKIHNLEQNRRKPGNADAKEYMLRRAREKLQRSKSRKQDSELESLIVAMVNTEQYKYDFESTLELTIYQFNECVRQVIQKVDYEHRMHGVYSGTVNVKDMRPDDLNWLSHKSK